MREETKENDKIKRDSFQGVGHTLGSGSSSRSNTNNSPSSSDTTTTASTPEGGVCHVPPSPEEVRRLRLAAFGGGGGAYSSSSSSSKPKSLAKEEKRVLQKEEVSKPNNDEEEEAEMNKEEEENEEDEELRAALALSMRCPSEIDEEEDEEETMETSEQKSEHHVAAKSEKREREQQHFPPPKNSSSPSEKSGSSILLSTTNLQSFHSIMWDTITTTREDKNRWKNQGIQPSSALWEEEDETNNDANTTENAMNIDDVVQEEKEEIINDVNSKLWGLTQSHGGPCGVLAAVQAEMLRLLLFGIHHTSSPPEHEYLYYPTNLNMSNQTLTKKYNISCKMVREAMAKSIGMILARAAVMPNLNNDDDDEGEKKEEEAVVRLVLPMNKKKEYRGLTWHALEPWDTSHQHSEEKEEEEEIAQKLGVWLISSSSQNQSLQTIPQSKSSSSTIQEEQPMVWTDKPESKRQRNTLKLSDDDRMSISSASSSSAATSTTTKRKRGRMEVLIALANAVAHFLLHGSSSTFQTSNDGEENEEEEEAMEKMKDEEECNDMDPPLKYFHNAGGVMLLTLSLVESRGVHCVKNDMDDPSNTLTSQFGHSSQELINLLLTGQAVSNVFDNTLTVSGALSCRGIQSRPLVGYLSLLESLRYCEVGGYYKSPFFPIWVVGSQNHFSVLFGDERCLKESKSDVLLEKCRRAFKAVEGGEENGFIEVSALGKVIDSLDLREKVGGDNGVQTLAATLEVSGAGIILWDDFWKASSRLLTGASFQSILDDEPEQEKPPLLLTQHGEPTNASKPSTMESDEELAKFLAAEWGAQDQSAQSPQSQQQSSASATTSTSNAVRQKSDEEIARELQAQWDAELDGGSNVGQASRGEGNRVTFNLQEGTDTDSAINVDNNDYDDDAKMTSVQKSTLDTAEEENFTTTSSSEEKCSDTKESSTSDGSAKQSQRLDFEKFGDSFPLYHYNGLRGGTLTSFRVTRLTPEEAVGASIALSSNSGSGGGHGGSSHSGASGTSSSNGAGDLEDVVRTKWPSCVFNWGGNNPPFID